MTRPTYETQQDVAHEEVVINLLCDKWKCTAHKAPRFYQTDWSLSKNGEVKAMAEIKFRNKSYPTYILSLHKFTNLLMGSISGVRHLLVVCWPEDGKRVVKYVEITHGLYSKVIHGGRKDRGDSQDQEPMVEIPIERFRTVGEI